MANTLKFGNGQWATKKGSTLAYNDENNNYKPLPFTFDRDSVATRVNKQGLIETVGADQPRIDYLNDSKGALLLEPSRTNLVTQSNNTTTNVWSHYSYTGGLIVDTYGYPSPNGKNEASRLVYTNSSLGSGGALLTTNITLQATGVYTISLWAKSVSGTKEIRFSPKSTGSAGPAGSRVTLTNEWKRYTHTFTNDGATDRGFQFRIADSEDSGDRTFDVWGMTIEEGTYATSTIQTQGSAVTRLADSCSDAGNDQVINSEEGCFYFEGNLFKGDDTNNIISITDGGVNNYIYLNFQTNTNQEKVRYTVSGSTQINYNFPSSETMYTNSKYAISYKTNEIKIYRNGVEIITDTSATMLSPNTLNKIQFSFNNNDYFKGYIKDLKLYNTALTDQELAALTQV